MTTRLFPEAREQSIALTIIGVCSGIANSVSYSVSFNYIIHPAYKPSLPFSVLGLTLGAILTQSAGWHWIFWTIGIVFLSIAAFCIFFIPNTSRKGEQKYGLGIVGVSILMGTGSTIYGGYS
jgi:uncharacterized membrane protein YfcA